MRVPEWALLKRFQGQRSKVKVILIIVCELYYYSYFRTNQRAPPLVYYKIGECYTGGGIHFDGVTSRITCWLSVDCYTFVGTAVSITVNRL